MITEDYVSFEVAKLLKEKGFKGQGEHFYEDNKITNFINYWFRITPEQRYEAIEAPTLQMAMKWLREVHDLHIQILPWRASEKETEKKWCCWVYKSYGMMGFEKYLNETSKSHEEAVEDALKYCLTYLI